MKSLKGMIENIFPILVGKIDGTDNDEVSWSVEVEDESEIEELYDLLYSLEPFFNKLGFELQMQDEQEYFGAALTINRISY